MPSLTENGKLRFQYFDIREMNDDTCGINNNKTQTNITPHMTDSQECLQASLAWLIESFFTVILEKIPHSIYGKLKIQIGESVFYIEKLLLPGARVSLVSSLDL